MGSLAGWLAGPLHFNFMRRALLASVLICEFWFGNVLAVGSDDF
ncbi:MAG TPA: hypothetical protein VII06_18445 [Chloroflexota bacterium]|jgi:hypothetical protein